MAFTHLHALPASLQELPVFGQAFQDQEVTGRQGKAGNRAAWQSQITALGTASSTLFLGCQVAIKPNSCREVYVASGSLPDRENGAGETGILPDPFMQHRKAKLE